MRLTRRDRIVRWIVLSGLLALVLLSSLLASPVFAGTCPIGGTCG